MHIAADTNYVSSLFCATAAAGLAALGTNDEEVFEDLKNVLYTDDAVAGEAAGIAMGLLCCGSGSDKAQEMLAYAHDTQHEKIIRGLAIGLALISYGIEEAADTLVEQMAREQDPILRYGAMYVIGLAYRGTGNNGAVQRLLHYAVSDVSDDVRRAAVLCLGFVLMGAPEQCPKIVALLAESFNPHVRYGAAMAVGLACAGGWERVPAGCAGSCCCMCAHFCVHAPLHACRSRAICLLYDSVNRSTAL
jgi:26S proteasome regulatory subunit N2